ncbi:hypothetical protein ACQY0O_006279 [Thecaphora frezii]
MSLAFVNSSVITAFQQLTQEDSRWDYILLGYRDTDAILHLYEAATGGIDSLRAKLRPAEPMFALLKFESKILLFLLLGTAVSGVRRARAFVHARSLPSMLGPSVHASGLIARPNELTVDFVKNMLEHKDGLVLLQPPSPSEPSPRSSDYGPPSRPDQPGRPRDEPGPSVMKRSVSEDGAAASRASRAQPGWLLPKQENKLASSKELRILAWRSASGLAAPSDLPEDDIFDHGRASFGADSEGSSTVRPCGSGSVVHVLHGAQRTGSPSSLNPSEADEASRHVHKSTVPHSARDVEETRQAPLRQEQQTFGTGRKVEREDEALRFGSAKNETRAERDFLRPSKSLSQQKRKPAVPPPAFAPPPTPDSPSILSLSLPASASLRQRSRSIPQSRPSGTMMKSPRIVVQTPAPNRHGSRDALPAPRDFRVDLQKGHMSPTHDSVCSFQTAELWRFAQDGESLSAFSSSPTTSQASRQSPSPRSPADRSIPKQRELGALLGPHGSTRSSETETLEGEGEWSSKRYHDAGGLAPSTSYYSSTHYSSDAPSLFDKELPPPPPGSDTTEITTPTDGGGSELDNLKAAALEARNRALAAERAARREIEKARLQQWRLEQELQEAQRLNREVLAREAIRRAKWAREQAARDRLDAYERSKLEAAERKRRKAKEMARQDSLRRAEEMAREQNRLEKERQEAKEEAERRKIQAAAREARLAAELEAQARRKAELEEKQRKEAAERELLAKEFEALVREGKELLRGNLIVQNDKKLSWKCRWFVLRGEGLDLYKSSTEPSPVETIRLRGRLRSVTDAFEECQMPHCLKIEVAPQEGAVDEDFVACGWFLSAESEEQKQSLYSGLQIASRLPSERNGSIGSL